MAIISALRNNWKKTIIGIGIGTYAFKYGIEEYQISTLLRSYSKKAAFYGDQSNKNPRNLIVILNPAAKKTKSEKIFFKYCEPILHLAGFTVDIVRTDSEGYAKRFVEHLKSLPYGIVVAGGDGSVSEVLTGLMRRKSDKCPIALIPLGNKSETSKKILNMAWSSKLTEIEALISTSLNIARDNIQEKSVFKIEQLANIKQQENRPIFSLGLLEWGIHRDIKSLENKYWYFWKASEYFSALVNAFNSKLSWNCKADVCFTKPCNGCKNCIVFREEESQKSKLWSRLSGNRILNGQGTIPLLNNTECEGNQTQSISASNLRIYLNETTENSNLVLETEENMKPGLHYFFKHISGEKKPHFIKFRTMTLIPDSYNVERSDLYSIDGEAYDVRSIKVSLIPKSIKIFI